VNVLDRLDGGLIVSIQPRSDSVLNAPETIALLARCAEANGAAGVRIEGAERVAAVRAAVGLPIVGLLKGPPSLGAPYITTSEADVEALASAGADLIAFDATARPRSGGPGVARLVEVIRRSGRSAFADCADLADGRAAAEAGAEVVATTLAGYTHATRGRPLPALDLVAAFAAFHEFVVCEGGVATPGDAGAARAAGARAICVGTAITDTDALVERFVRAVRAGVDSRDPV
jgi:N-acylglucosamine-6-phosphate 2-epimerase